MTWELSGSYYEACNCEAVCPCRRYGDHQGGRSTYETCDFVLSWKIEKGHVGGRSLAGLATVMTGSYSDDESGSPWRVAVFVDDAGTKQQRGDLADIFIGRLGGDTHRLFGGGIAEVAMVRPATILLVHDPGRWHIGVSTFIEVRSTVAASDEGAVSCGISDHSPGTELISDVIVVSAPPFEWELREKCAFQSPFTYTG